MTITIFDGNNAIWRLAKKMPELTVNGRPIQVVYGFLRLIRASLEEFEPDTALVVWDGRREGRLIRSEIWGGYKARRIHKHEVDEEKQAEVAKVMVQLAMVQKTLSYLSIAQVSLPNIEADDLIAVACKTLEGKKVIVSSDQDMLQLVRKDVDVYSPIRGELYDEANFREKIGLSPRQFLEMRVLTGDKTDEIPGVARGFGEITARDLIKKYGSLETLWKPSVEKKISGQSNRHALLYSEGTRERAALNFRLMDLSLIDSPTAASLIKREINAIRHVNTLAVRRYFLEQEFQSLLQDFTRWLAPFESLSKKEAT